jgi:hypothetical protein
MPSEQTTLLSSTPAEFASRYQIGQELELKDNTGTEVARAIVVAYDPIADELSVTDHKGPVPPNHWHTAVHDYATQTWLPAAIWDRGDAGKFEPHYSAEHRQAERLGEPVAYSTSFVEKRVGAIAAQVAEIVSVE